MVIHSYSLIYRPSARKIITAWLEFFYSQVALTAEPMVKLRAMGVNSALTATFPITGCTLPTPCRPFGILVCEDRILAAGALVWSPAIHRLPG
ncbi:MAG: hypothetical protein M1399_07385 [Actinobacteria bacterium]|nr:hypothetical protein [Actinomycetota bacterium]MCL5446649.1 hypothetical protein [Actinomycetota bacterium]